MARGRMRILSLVIKILILLAIIGVGVLIYSTCAGSPIIQKIDKTLPDTTIAPYEVYTRTHLYLVRQANLNDDGSVTMHEWYERDGDKWLFHEEPVTLPKVLRPRIERR